MTRAAFATRIVRRFGSRIALDGVTLSVSGGEVVGIIGPNGAGKTTLLRILAGMLRSSSGGVTRNADLATLYFGGEHTLPPDVRADRWSRLFGVSSAPKRRIGLLSRGTRQRMGLEAILSVRKPGLILLDEPWEGLDPDASRWLSEKLIARRLGGSAIVVSSHRIHDLASTCDRCVFLVDGRLAGPEVVCEFDVSPDERVKELLAAFDAVKRRPA